MQLDFMFDVESVEREAIPDEPGSVMLRFNSGEFSAEVWTDSEHMAVLVNAIIEARTKATRTPSTWSPQQVAIYGLTFRPRIELEDIEVYPPGDEQGEHIPYWTVVLTDGDDGSTLHMAMSEETALRLAALGMRELGHERFELDS